MSLDGSRPVEDEDADVRHRQVLQQKAVMVLQPPPQTTGFSQTRRTKMSPRPKRVSLEGKSNRWGWASGVAGVNWSHPARWGGAEACGTILHL